MKLSLTPRFLVAFCLAMPIVSACGSKPERAVETDGAIELAASAETRAELGFEHWDVVERDAEAIVRGYGPMGTAPIAELRYRTIDLGGRRVVTVSLRSANGEGSIRFELDDLAGNEPALGKTESTLPSSDEAELILKRFGADAAEAAGSGTLLSVRTNIVGDGVALVSKCDAALLKCQVWLAQFVESLIATNTEKVERGSNCTLERVWEKRCKEDSEKCSVGLLRLGRASCEAEKWRLSEKLKALDAQYRGTCSRLEHFPECNGP